MDYFDESEMAWRLWNLMDDLQNLLWDCYEDAFLDFIKIEYNQKFGPPPF